MTHSSLPPSDWVHRWAHLIAPGASVLDLACGTGRHARFLAARGHPVLALDRDADALAGLSGVPGVETVRADLEDGSPWPLDGRRFGAVIVTNYLFRPLFPVFAAAVAPAGLLLYETFARGNERFGKPSNPDFLLEPGELLQAFGEAFCVVAFEQGDTSRPRAAAIQRICALRVPYEPVRLDPPGA